MGKHTHSANAWQGSLNTLAQNGTSLTNSQPIIVMGEGSEISDSKSLLGRAKRKMITQKMALSLIDVVNGKEAHERKKGYWNTYHCQNTIHTSGGRIYGKYCKNRFCTLCCSIRKAEIINRYLPVIKMWPQPYFVTLTVKACSLVNLKARLKACIRAFKKINNKYRKRNQRGDNVRLIGIKSLECNYNPVKKTYNPHMHLIVATKEIADILIAEWLEIWTVRYANKLAQNMRPVEGLERDLIEVVKYGSKIFTETDVNKKSKQTADRNIYVVALDNIFTAMQGLRIFDRFGFNLPKEVINAPRSTVLVDYQEWIFDLRYHDWLNSENELTLTGYEPNSELVSLMMNNIIIQD